MAKSMKPGGGGRFEKLSNELSHEKGVYDPKALAAVIGRRKEGAKTFNKQAAAGRRRAQKK